MRRAFRFVKATLIWILAVPYMIWQLGNLSNQAVLIANHGKFPVMINETQATEYPTGMLDSYHCLMTKDTHLNALGDIFEIVDNEHSSVGDVFLDLGNDLQPYTQLVWLCLFLAKYGVRGEL